MKERNVSGEKLPSHGKGVESAEANESRRESVELLICFPEARTKILANGAGAKSEEKL